jgi:hypothetical protein
VPVTQTGSTQESTGKTLQYGDYNYENSIKTVQLYPFQGTPTDALEPAAVSITQPFPLLLEFDDLREEAESYYAKIILCNANWSPSTLNEMDYLFQFNEFPLQQYEFSFNTRIPYVHYSFEVPKVKVPGNYLLVVFRNNNPQDLILSRRFMVYTNDVAIRSDIGISTGIVERTRNQQIEFEIDYSRINVANPYTDIVVILRQNQRWDNAIANLKPTLIREDQTTLVYRHFNLENNFAGGNEFRFFDLRAVRFLGQNVDRIDVNETNVEADLMVDRSRLNESYSQIRDMNGQYLIENMEQRNPRIESEYINTRFFLQLEDTVFSNVYLGGELVNWNYNQESRMKYDPVNNLYTNELLLKQGWYNYAYLAGNEGNPTTFPLEGSHFETENEYEILVYFRPIGFRYDVLAGYVHLIHNQRN